MQTYYKKLLLLLILLTVLFFLSLALGSAPDEPSELTQEQLNKALVQPALESLAWSDPNRLEFFDPNYIHHLPAKGWYIRLGWHWWQGADKIEPRASWGP